MVVVVITLVLANDCSKSRVKVSVVALVAMS